MWSEASGWDKEDDLVRHKIETSGIQKKTISSPSSYLSHHVKSHRMASQTCVRSVVDGWACRGEAIFGRIDMDIYTARRTVVAFLNQVIDTLE